VDDTFRRQVSASSLAASGHAVISNSNLATVSVPWIPGGGALVMTAKGEWLLETFEEYQPIDGAIDVDDLGYRQFRTSAEGLWRFLPRTSAVLTAGWFNRTPDASTRDDATGFDVLAGLTGLLTSRISATVKLGYATTSTRFLDVDTMAANLGVEWLPLETLSLRAGYTRSLGIDPFASVYAADGVTAGGRIRIAERVVFRGELRYDRLQFKVIPGAETAFLRFDPSVEGQLGRWLTLGLGYVFSSRTASWPVGAPPDYSKNEAFLKLALTY
jgi:hypothetical protein